MPKMKTHRGAAKRFRKTASGEFRHKTVFRAKKMAKKRSDRKRRLRRGALVSPVEVKRLRRVLPYV